MEEKAWKGCGQRVELKIWRIVKFKASIKLSLRSLVIISCVVGAVSSCMSNLGWKYTSAGDVSVNTPSRDVLINHNNTFYPSNNDVVVIITVSLQSNITLKFMRHFDLCHLKDN